MRMIPIDPGWRPVRLLAIGILLVASAACDEPQETRLDRAMRLRDAGDLQAAIWELHAATLDDPGNAELHRAAALLHLESGEAPAAEFAFRKAIELGAEDDETRLGFAEALFLQDKYRLLREFLDTAGFSTNRAEAESLKLKGMALDGLREHPAAERAFLQLLKKLDREWFHHSDPLDIPAFIRNLEAERHDYAGLDRALDYRERLATLPVGEWVTIHKQEVHDAVFFSRQGHGGSAFDLKRGRLMLFGSDTHDYGDIAGKNWKNNIFFFDPALGEWTESYPRDPVSTFRVNDSGIPVAGETGEHPWAMHTYGAVSYDAGRDELVVSSHPAHLEPGKFTYMLQSVWPQIRHHPTWVFELRTNEWKALRAPSESFFMHATAYDSDRSLIIGYKTAGIFELSGSPRSWYRVVEGGLLDQDNNAVYDSRHKALVVFGSGDGSNDIVAYEPATGRHQKMPTAGLRPPKGRFAPMAFHSGIGKTVVLVQRNQTASITGGTTETWLYDLGRDAWEQVETATLDFGIYRNYNLAYDPFHDFLLFVPNPHGPLSLTTVLALRL